MSQVSTAQGSNAVVTNSELGKVLAQVENFGEMVIDKIKNATIGLLNGTGLLGDTIHLNGARPGGANIDDGKRYQHRGRRGKRRRHPHPQRRRFGEFALRSRRQRHRRRRQRRRYAHRRSRQRLLFGDDGLDAASFASSPRGVLINLASQVATDGVDSDALSSIENAIGSAFYDMIVSSDAANEMDAGDGNDTVSYDLGARPD